MGPSSQLVQSTYVPQPIQLAGQLAQNFEGRYQQARQDIDIAKAGLTEMDVPDHPLAQELASSKAMEYEDKLDSLVKDGMLHKKNVDIQSLVRQIESDPELRNLKEQAQEYRKYLEEMRNKKLPSDIKNQTIAETRSMYDPENGFSYVYGPDKWEDEGEFVADIMNDMGFDETTSHKQTTKQTVFDRNGNEITQRVSNTTKDLAVDRQTAITQLQRRILEDDQIMSQLSHEAMLNGGGQEYIQERVFNLADQAYRTERSKYGNFYETEDGKEIFKSKIFDRETLQDIQPVDPNSDSGKINEAARRSINAMQASVPVQTRQPIVDGTDSAFDTYEEFNESLLKASQDFNRRYVTTKNGKIKDASDGTIIGTADGEPLDDGNRTSRKWKEYQIAREDVAQKQMRAAQYWEAVEATFDNAQVPLTLDDKGNITTTDDYTGQLGLLEDSDYDTDITGINFPGQEGDFIESEKETESEYYFSDYSRVRGKHYKKLPNQYKGLTVRETLSPNKLARNNTEGSRIYSFWDDKGKTAYDVIAKNLDEAKEKLDEKFQEFGDELLQEAESLFRFKKGYVANRYLIHDEEMRKNTNSYIQNADMGILSAKKIDSEGNVSDISDELRNLNIDKADIRTTDIVTSGDGKIFLKGDYISEGRTINDIYFYSPGIEKSLRSDGYAMESSFNAQVYDNIPYVNIPGEGAKNFKTVLKENQLAQYGITNMDINGQKIKAIEIERVGQSDVTYKFINANGEPIQLSENSSILPSTSSDSPYEVIHRFLANYLSMKRTIHSK